MKVNFTQCPLRFKKKQQEIKKKKLYINIECGVSLTE